MLLNQINTVYIQSALDYLRAQGEVIKEEDEARLPPLGRKHINFLEHFSFMLPKIVADGQLRPLNVTEERAEGYFAWSTFSLQCLSNPNILFFL
jgi:hypothetical protein